MSDARGNHRGMPDDFDAMYAETPPWDIGRPQEAFMRVAEAGELRGRVLDVGCGTGEHTLLAAGRGLDATGVDAAPSAIAIAQRKATERGLSARFLVLDVFDLPALGERFDTVLDCGLFHVFGDDERPRFVQSLGAVVPPGGRYHLLCFSEHQPGEWGPRRVTQDEIRTCFGDDWSVDAITEATLDITIDPAGARAWHASMTRL
jgi:cyclopropane fatty-acyl-phospholipid synthase-like methyltransferase